uniref:Uncharacterized protein n=1 Tax=Peronospora matthiolae TaxID=2874970 RepID=A0AAV1TRT0_9STRA
MANEASSGSRGRPFFVQSEKAARADDRDPWASWAEAGRNQSSELFRPAFRDKEEYGRNPCLRFASRPLSRLLLVSSCMILQCEVPPDM